METVPKLIGHVEKVEQEEFKEQPEGDRPVAEKEVSGGLTADREVAAAGETGGEQATSEDTEKVDEMAKPTDKDKVDKPTDKDEMTECTDKDDKATGSERKKPRSTPSISRMKDEHHRAKIKEQE